MLAKLIISLKHIRTVQNLGIHELRVCGAKQESCGYDTTYQSFRCLQKPKPMNLCEFVSNYGPIMSFEGVLDV